MTADSLVAALRAECAYAQDTVVRMVCRHPGCDWWVQASSNPEMDHHLREHTRTHQEPQQ